MYTAQIILKCLAFIQFIFFIVILSFFALSIALVNFICSSLVVFFSPLLVTFVLRQTTSIDIFRLEYLHLLWEKHVYTIFHEWSRTIYKNELEVRKSVSKLIAFQSSVSKMLIRIWTIRRILLSSSKWLVAK